MLGDTEDRWKEIFAAAGKTYHPPRLRLFTGVEQGGCGLARSAMGPFYCPTDQRIYLDISFFDDLQNKFGGCSNNNACKFSQAYVIAHEVGHHVQDELGILPRVRQEQQATSSKAERNQLQVRIELQADCLAGIWANRAQRKHNFLDPGDVDQALQTASAIGDDRLQKETQGYVVPDAFTHGTSEQRKRWFMAGFKQGRHRRLQYAVGRRAVVIFLLIPAPDHVGGNLRRETRGNVLGPRFRGDERTYICYVCVKVYRCLGSTRTNSSCR